MGIHVVDVRQVSDVTQAVEVRLVAKVMNRPD